MNMLTQDKHAVKRVLSAVLGAAIEHDPYRASLASVTCQLAARLSTLHVPTRFNLTAIDATLTVLGDERVDDLVSGASLPVSVPVSTYELRQLDDFLTWFVAYGIDQLAGGVQ